MNQDITPASSNQTPSSPSPEGTPAPATDTYAAPQQPAGQVIAQQAGPRHGKGKAVLLALLVLLLLAAVAGVYYWQQGKVNDATTAKTAVENQVATLKSQLSSAEAKAKDTKAATATPAANYNVVTGDATVLAQTTATVNSLYKPGSVDEIWLEYGTTPDALKTATPHITQGLGAGDATTYAQQAFKLTGLSGGQNYFYHVAAKSKGVTLYGGTASFTTTK